MNPMGILLILDFLLGAYMNEGDRSDPDVMQTFYGLTHKDVLEESKSFYDPHGVFYCRTCIGSRRWEETQNGQLCLAPEGNNGG